MKMIRSELDCLNGIGIGVDQQLRRNVSITMQSHNGDYILLFAKVGKKCSVTTSSTKTLS